MFKGAFTALVTPFKNNGIDEAAFRNFIAFQIDEGTNGLVPCGTTGESATLTYEEHKRVVEITVTAAAGKVPVIAGTGSNSTDETIALTAHAKKAGADAALLITPYYNKPTQEGLYLHFRKVAESVDIPLILYNVPGRTAVNMLPETVARLSKIDNVIGIKEATADLEQASWLRAECGEDFLLLSGDDATLLPFLSIGGDGVISVVSNVAPKAMADLCLAWREGDLARAKEIHFQLLPLCRALFSETNPIPVKEAVHMAGRISEEIRLPLTRLEDEKREVLRNVLTGLRLL